MRTLKRALVLAAFALPVVSIAAIDETLRIRETIEINAPADKVWAHAGNFADMSWHPAVAKTTLSSGTANAAGAQRVLVLKDGGTIHETLTEFDDASHVLKYTITESVLPLREYDSTLQVQAVGEGKTKVTWKSMFKRKDPAHEPKVGEDDKTARDTVTSIYQGGLQHLKALSEK